MARTIAVELAHVTKQFGSVTAVDSVSLQLYDGEFFSLLGPSGCGKTTILRMLAGFEYPTTGSITIHEREMSNIPPYKRPVNTVFQSYALFPHMTVEQNVAFGLEMKNIPREETRTRVAEALEMVRLSEYGSRRPRQLSGGQQQRVALARALVNQPEVLLLDEPLAALDEKLRKEMQLELKGLQERLGITFLFVTHDQEEALTMSDRIGVMSRGRILQVGDPIEIYERPTSRFVADFIGETNFLSGTVCAIQGNLTTINASSGMLLRGLAQQPVRVGQQVTISVRPEKVFLHPLDNGNGSTPRSDANTAQVQVERISYIGSDTRIIVRLPDGNLFDVWESNTRSTLDRDEYWQIGEQALLAWPDENALVLTE